MTAIAEHAVETEAHERHGLLAWLWRVVVLVFLVASLGVIAAAVVIPRVTGSTPFTILTGSMAPLYPPGTLVVTKPVEVDELRVGDVITYQLESGKEAVVTHRITGIGVRLDGEYELRTQGDANVVEDREPVRPVQLRGKIWYSVPWVGRAGALISADQREAAITAIAGALGLYALWSFASGLLGRGRRS